MKKKLVIILGDQLFEKHPCLDEECDILMVESITECNRLRYHKFRLAYLFTTMREYADYLRNNGKTVHYVRLEEEKDFKQVLLAFIPLYSSIAIYEVNDKYFLKQLNSWVSPVTLEVYDSGNSQMFLTPKKKFSEWLTNNGKKKLMMANFYSWQRKRLNLLLDIENKPLFGKWSFDDENRKKLPKTQQLPTIDWSYTSKHFESLSKEIEKLLPNNPGTITNLWLPVTHLQVRKQLEYFIENQLEWFGPYEDALSTRSSTLFHSVLSPAINNGLITPQEIIDSVITAYSKNPNLHFSSIEGFIRQIIGWREWIKGLYDHVYEEDLSQYNHLKSHKPLPEYFYTYDLNHPELSSNLPLKQVLETVNKLSWAHHIERLMIVSNWMLLNEYDPMQCFEWFSSQFVDAYEWVMVGNVLGMGLFADGGIFATKPYIAGGNYIKKMSDYPDSKQWEHIWTDKYWEFLKKHKELFMNNPRMRMIIAAKFKN